MIFVKRHREVLAACDEDLIGKKFEDRGLILDIKESFYRGEIVSGEELSEMLTDYNNINLVGEQTIKIAKRNKLVNKIGRVKGVPYAIIFKV